MNHVRVAVFTSALLVIALAAAAQQRKLAPTAIPAQPSTGLAPTAGLEPMIKPARVRVLMDLVVKTATDLVSGGLGNTEDEVYYWLIEPKKGNALQIKEVRRYGTDGYWHMGRYAEYKLRRILFEGEVSAQAPTMLGLVISEQDASSVLGGSSGGGESGTFDATLTQGIAEARSRTKDRDHQILGTMQIEVRPNRIVPKIIHPGYKIDKAEDTSVRVDFGFYIARVYMVPISEPRPTGRHWTADEDDDCQPEKTLTVTSKTGEVVAPKGDRTVAVQLPDRRFTWHCGGSEEFATMPKLTDEIDVVRRTDTDSVHWIGFGRDALKPDLSR